MTLPAVKAKLLEGKKGLIVGIANDRSIAWGCARAFRALGADLAITYLNEKAKPHVEPLAREVEAPIFMPMDVMADGQLEAVFDRIAADELFGIDRTSLAELAQPERYTGLSAQQTERFLIEDVDPVLAAEREQIRDEVGEVRV